LTTGNNMDIFTIRCVEVLLPREMVRSLNPVDK
jgi:hypothetical protein